MTDLADSTAEELKSCCAALYEADWVRLLLGESFHPGGLALTERLGRLLGLDAGKLVLDVACGRGVSAIHLVRTFGCRVIGIEYGAASVAAAREAAECAGLAALTEFRVGDAETLPLEDASVDAVLCECAFCTFPKKPRAAEEFARVLHPGGSIGLSDLTRNGDLPPALNGLLAWVACLADARSVDEYLGYLLAAGLRNPSIELHDEALAQLVLDVRRKLLGAQLLARLGVLQLPEADFERAKDVAWAAVDAIRAGTLGYALMTARRG